MLYKALDLGRFFSITQETENGYEIWKFLEGGSQDVGWNDSGMNHWMTISTT
jgi:hypothetical protein